MVQGAGAQKCKSVCKYCIGEIAASNRLFEDEGDWECPESRAETSARRAQEKTERTLWKMLDDLDIKVQKADLKLAKDQAKKKAAESGRAAKVRVASETSRKITSFFKKSKERRPPTRDSHHVSDWEMEDLDPSSALEMLWDDTPALTSAQVELLNSKRDRAMRLRLAKRKKAEAVEKHRRKQELEEMADHLKSVLVTRLFDMLDEETLRSAQLSRLLQVVCLLVWTKRWGHTFCLLTWTTWWRRC